MLRLTAVLFALGLLLAPAAHAKRVRCDAGTTEFATGALRVFAIHYRDVRGNVEGSHTFACLGARGRPVELGDNDWGSITGDSDGGTPVLVFSGGRYLAVGHWESGEGGLEDAGYNVLDLRTRRLLTSISMGEVPDAEPPLRLSANGDAILTDEHSVLLFTPGARKGVVLSTSPVDASGAAISGSTVYWTENGAPHASTLASAAAADTVDTTQTPVYADQGIACDRRSGTTVAHSWQVRILRRGAALSACLDRRTFGLPPNTLLADVQIARERWVFTGTSVIDLKARRTVIKLARPRSATLLGDGTLAWIGDDGRLLAQSPGAAAPTVLSGAGAALSSSGTTVYWTEAGAPHAWADGK